jgi:hypothetical protein
MKNIFILFLTSTLLFTQCGCATLYGGQISDCQRHRPPKGQPSRQIRSFALTCDIIFGLFLFEIPVVIDFLTKAIYKPCEYVSTKSGNQKQQIDSPSQQPQQTESIKRVNTPPKGTVSYLDYKYGFRDMKFETLIENANDMSLITDTIDNKRGNKNIQHYIKTSDSLNVGDYDLKSIKYEFYKGKLSVIYLRTKGYTNSRGILAILKNLYGIPFQSNQYIEEYLWNGARVDLFYDENSITNDALIMFGCKKIEGQKRQDEKQNQKKAESGF